MINTTYKLAPWADMLYACDERWWDYYKGAPDFEGIKVSQSAVACETYDDIHQVQGKMGTTLSTDPKFIHYGQNSGFQALNLACFLGARRVLLLGYDMQRTDGKCHHHGPHPKSLKQPVSFDKWCQHFAKAAPQIEAMGVEVINCTARTALKCFRRADLKEVL